MTRTGKMRLLLMFVALACMAFGLWRGEAVLIFHKAFRVCMECIGLG